MPIDFKTYLDDLNKTASRKYSAKEILGIMPKSEFTNIPDDEIEEDRADELTPVSPVSHFDNFVAKHPDRDPEILKEGFSAIQERVKNKDGIKYGEPITADYLEELGRERINQQAPGLFKEGIRSFARGAIDLPGMAGKGMQWLDPDGGDETISDMGKKLETFSTETQAKLEPSIGISKQAELSPWYSPRHMIARGPESTVASLAPFATGLATGAVAGPVAGAAAGLATLGGLFYGGAAEDKYRQAKESGLSDEDAKSLANWEGGLEAGGELVGDILFMGLSNIPLKLFKLAPKSVQKGVINGITAKTGIKDTLKAIGKTMAAETVTEVGQAMGQTYASNQYGVEAGSMLDNSLDVIGPTIFMSLVFGGAGAAHTARINQKKTEIVRALSDPASTQEDFDNSLREVAQAAQSIDPKVAKQFTEFAVKKREQGQPVIIGDDSLYAPAKQNLTQWLQTGQRNGQEFTPVEADQFIREKLSTGEFTDEDLQSIKEENPVIRDVVTKIDAERITERAKELSGLTFQMADNWNKIQQDAIQVEESEFDQEWNQRAGEGERRKKQTEDLKAQKQRQIIENKKILSDPTYLARKANDYKMEGIESEGVPFNQGQEEINQNVKELSREQQFKRYAADSIRQKKLGEEFQARHMAENQKIDERLKSQKESIRSFPEQLKAEKERRAQRDLIQSQKVEQEREYQKKIETERKAGKVPQEIGRIADYQKDIVEGTPRNMRIAKKSHAIDMLIQQANGTQTRSYFYDKATDQNIAVPATSPRWMKDLGGVLSRKEIENLATKYREQVLEGKQTPKKDLLTDKQRGQINEYILPAINKIMADHADEFKSKVEMEQDGYKFVSKPIVAFDFNPGDTLLDFNGNTGESEVIGTSENGIIIKLPNGKTSEIDGFDAINVSAFKEGNGQVKQSEGYVPEKKQAESQQDLLQGFVNKAQNTPTPDTMEEMPTIEGLRQKLQAYRQREQEIQGKIDSAKDAKTKEHLNKRLETVQGKIGSINPFIRDLIVDNKNVDESYNNQKDALDRKLISINNAALSGEEYSNQHDQVTNALRKLKNDYNTAIKDPIYSELSIKRTKQDQEPDKNRRYQEAKGKAHDYLVTRKTNERKQELDNLASQIQQKIDSVKSIAKQRRDNGDDISVTNQELASVVKDGQKYLDWIKQRGYDSVDSSGQAVSSLHLGNKKGYQFTAIPQEIDEYLKTQTPEIAASTPQIRENLTNQAGIVEDSKAPFEFDARTKFKDLDDARKDFIDKKILEAGSIKAVQAKYNDDAVVDNYARERAGEIFGEIESTTNKSGISESQQPTEAPQAKHAWEMTREEWIEKKKLKIKKPIPQSQILAWENQYDNNLKDAPRDAVIPIKVMESLSKVKRDSLLKGNDARTEFWNKNGSHNIWRMTYQQLLKDDPTRGKQDNFRQMHRSAVQQAISEGKPVSASVLADYPDLAERYRPAQKETPEVAPATETKDKQIEELKPTEVEKEKPGISVGAKAIWKAKNRTGTITNIDDKTGKVTLSFPAGNLRSTYVELDRDKLDVDTEQTEKISQEKEVAPEQTGPEDVTPEKTGEKTKESSKTQFSIAPASPKLHVVHNLTADNIMHADKMGGLPVPSIAITSHETGGITGFGEISLIADPSFIDPQKDKSSKVFNSDIYSPRYPSVKYQINRAALRDAEDKLASSGEAMGKKIYDNMGRRLESVLDESSIEDKGIKTLYDSPIVQYEYLKSINKAPKAVFKEKPSLPSIFKKFAGNSSPLDIASDTGFKQLANDHFNKKIDNSERKIKLFFEEDGSVKHNLLISFARDVISFNAPKEIDSVAMGESVRSKLKSDKIKAGFKLWVNENFSDIIVDERIFDGFNASGSKKKWLPHNLDTVVKIMKKKLQDGEDFNYGVKSVRAVTTKQFKSIKEIQQDRGKILSEQDIIPLIDEVNEGYESIVSQLRDYYKYDKNSYRYSDEASEALKEFARKGKRGFKDFYNNVPDELIKEVGEFLQKLGNMPTQYFEAKIQRAVSLSEFKYAVVPKNTSKEVKDKLKAYGLIVKTYDPKDKDSKNKVIASLSDVLFSKVEQSQVAATPPGNNLSIPMVQKYFRDKGQTTGVNSDGSLWIRLQNGLGLNIELVKRMSDAEYEMAISSGKMNRGGQIAGQITRNNIKLATDFANKETLNHELEHLMENSGILNSDDIKALNHQIKKFNRQGKLEFELSEDDMENRANFLAQVLANREQYRGTVLGNILQKIADFIDSLLYIGRSSTTKIARGMETGRIFSITPDAKPRFTTIDGQSVWGVPGQRQNEIQSWHGSPYQIDDSFSDEKLGSGEGIAAFGSGRYQTDTRAIAERYARMAEQRKVANGEMVPITLTSHPKINSVKNRISSMIEDLQSGVQIEDLDNQKAELEDIFENKWTQTPAPVVREIEKLEEFYNRNLKELGSLEKQAPGYLYQSTIHKGKSPDQYDYLDWYQPLTEGQRAKLAAKNVKGIKPEDTTELIYKKLTKRLGSPRAATQFLLKAGIDGIKYKAGSLSGVKDSQATNYVVFDPKEITINERIQYSAIAPSSLNELSRKERKITDSLIKQGTLNPVTEQQAMSLLQQSGEFSGESKFSLRTKPEPKKTIKAYKLFRVNKSKKGQLFPLFVGANESVDMGVWYDADIGEMDNKGKVKSKLGGLAFRPGWHAGDSPVATHIGEGGQPPQYRPENQVWAEIEVAADVDWQTEANKRATISKAGKPIAKTAHITDQIPIDGHYRYKTNPNMTGEWIITGAMKVNRVLSDKEIKEINDKAGLADLPRKDNAEFDAKKYGFDIKYSKSGLIQGFVLNGKAYIVPENIESGKLWNVVRHEVGVHIGQMLHNDAEFNRLKGRVASRRDEQSTTGEAIRKAYARANAAGTKPEYMEEEVLGYLVEDSPDVSIARRVIALIKKYLQKIGITYDLTQADMAALADIAIRREANRRGADMQQGEARFAFAGVKAKTANSPMLQKAQEMKAQGKSREQIWENTGWWEIIPGQWSFEVSPDDIKLEDVWQILDKDINWRKRTLKKINSLDELSGKQKERLFRIRDMLDGLLISDITSSDLIKEYPVFKNTKVVWVDDINFGGQVESGPNLTIIKIGRFNNKQDFEKILIHEIQHIIQREEGFAKGGSPRLFKLENHPNPWRAYKLLTGEVESRLVEKRLDMTVSERKAEPPFVTLEKMLKEEGLFEEGQKPEDVLISRYDQQGDIRHSIAPTPEERNDPLDIPERSSLFDTLKYNLLNNLDPFKKAQEKLGGVSPEADVLAKETLRISKAKNDIDEGKEKYVNPIMKLIADNNKSVDDVDEYLYSRHAPEANERLKYTTAKEWLLKLDKIRNSDALRKKIKEIDEYLLLNPAMNPKEAYYKTLVKEFEGATEDKELALYDKWKYFISKPSGMTTEDANKLQEKWANDETMKKIAALFDKMNQEKLDISLAAGRMTPEEYQAISGAFEYYAPLHRIGYDSAPSVGRGVTNLGRDTMARGGSTLKVVDILVNAIASYETTISKAHKAETARAFKNFIDVLPENSNFITLIRPNMRAEYDDAGNIRHVIAQEVRDNQVKFKVDGVTYLAEANRRNQHAMRIIEHIKDNPSKSGWLVEHLNKVNRVLALVNTSLSPEFMFSNFIRDLQTASINLSDSQVSGMTKKIVTEVPTALKALHNFIRGDKSHGWSETIRLYNKSGAPIGWMDNIGDIEQRVKKLDKAIELLRPTQDIAKNRRALVLGHRQIKKVFNVIMDYNNIVENAVRLSTFKNAVDAGVSVEQAAILAKGLTVNFNQKGTMGAVMNSLYLFSNAGIQGSAKIISVLVKSKRARKIVGTSMLISAALAVANRGMGGDDDDGIPYYDKIDQFVKERNIILMIPGGKGKYAQLPLPWGYNVFWAMGEELGIAFGTNKKYNAFEGASRMLTATLNAFNPLQSATIAQTLSPTLFDPVVQVAENKTWSGSPLMPEKNSFAKIPEPDSQRYWDSARQPSIWFAKLLNELSLGDEVKPGKIDISPEVLDMVWDTFTGSTGKFLVNTISVPIKALSGDDLTMREIPFVRRFSGEKSEYADSKLFRANKEHVYQLHEQAEKYPERIREFKKDKAFYMKSQLESVEKKIKRLYKAKKTAKSDDIADQLQKRIDSVMMKFNAAYYKMVN